MASTYRSVATRYGQARLADALESGAPVGLHTMALGDGNGSIVSPNENMKSLVSEVYRAEINEIERIDDTTVRVALRVPSETGGFTVREVGLFDDDGKMVAVGNYAATYKPTPDDGAVRELYVRMWLKVSSVDQVTITVDTSIIYATKEWVTARIADHAGSREHPYATTNEPGFVRLTTLSEAIKGANQQAVPSIAHVFRAFQQFGLGAVEVPRIDGAEPAETRFVYSSEGVDGLSWPMGINVSRGGTRDVQLLIQSLGSDIRAIVRARDSGQDAAPFMSAELWHTGNHGPDSGLDADTVDGLQATQLARKDLARETFAGSVGVGGIVPSGGKDFDNGKAVALGDDDSGIRGGGDGVVELWANNRRIGRIDKNGLDIIGAGKFSAALEVVSNLVIGGKLYMGSTALMQLDALGENGKAYIHGPDASGDDVLSIERRGRGDYVLRIGNSGMVWHSDNDGPGSGLDADTLDGEHGSYYRDAGHLNAGTIPRARLPYATESSTGGVELATVDEGRSGQSERVVSTPLAVRAYVRQFGLGGDGIPAQDFGGDFRQAPRYNAFLAGAGSDGVGPGEHYWPALSLYRSSSDRRSQVHVSSSDLRFMGATGNDWGELRTVWHDGNIDPVATSRNVRTGDGLAGGGSLASDRTLSVDASVVRTNKDRQVIGGTVEFSGPLYLTNSAPLQLARLANGKAYIHGPDGSGDDVLAIERTSKSDYKLLVNNSGLVWHSGNHGPGSGLDADTVDGLQAAQLARKDLARETFKGSIGVGGIAPSGGKDFDNGKAVALGDDDSGIRGGADGVIELWSNNKRVVGIDGSSLSAPGLDGAFRSLQFAYTGHDSDAPYSDYPPGLTIAEKSTADGYPFQGSVMTYNGGAYRSFQLQVEKQSGRIASRGCDGSNGWTRWASGWTDRHMGHGSGLDADTLDGAHGSYYRDAGNLNSGTVPKTRLSGKYDVDISGDAHTLQGHGVGTNAGQLMEVGAFGLGSNGANLPGHEDGSPNRTTFFYSSKNIDGVSWPAGINLSRDGGNRDAQLLISSLGSEIRSILRMRDSATAGNDWISQEIWHTGNLARAGLNVKTYDTRGDYTFSVPDQLKSGLLKARVTVIGAGGGGGQRGNNAGSGGGGGGISTALVDLSGVSSVPVTVGRYGSGGNAASNGTGESGATSSFGSYCSATGGKGGAPESPGAGGEGRGGFWNSSLGPGSIPSQSGSGQYGRSGSGGGPGGVGFNDSNSGGGHDAVGPGGGGGGSVGNNSGGSGGEGLVIIEW